MMPASHLEVLVEEASAEVALECLLPAILGPETTFRIHPHQGKQDLLRKLPARLHGYKRWLPESWIGVVLIDRDGLSCVEVKGDLERMARDAGLLTKVAAGTGRTFQVLNRIAIEELEAWFFGDVEAICSAYPRFPRTLGERSGYRDPDAIQGGTWEALERELQRAGYHSGGLSKLKAARDIAAKMVPARNRSRSFRVFCDGIRVATSS